VPACSVRPVRRASWPRAAIPRSLAAPPLAPLPLLLPLPDATEWLTSGPRVLQVFVEPEERGQGLGEIVMQAALISALERGRKVAHLLVCDRNERAVNLYKRTGFTKDFDNSKEDTVHNVIMGEQ
jgi:GNAT superfamily N-acetyltransferase